MELTRDWLPDYIEDMTLTYKTVEEYGQETFADGADYSADEFKEDMDNGFIEELTLGTYNGATDTFQKRQIDKYHLYDAVVQYLHDTDYSDVETMYDDYEEGEVTTDMIVEDIVNMYTLLIIGDDIYLDRN